MKVYRVQFAYGAHIACPTVHKDEAPAKKETAFLLDNWLMRNVGAIARHHARKGDHPAFARDGALLVQQVRALLAEGRIWEAYDLFQDFHDRYEFEFENPLYMVVGTVVVDTREAEPYRKRRAMPVPPMPPYALDPEALPPWMINPEEFEVVSVLRNVIERFRERLIAEGRTITFGEFRRQASEVVQKLLEETEGREDLTIEQQVEMAEQALKRRFGLSGPAREGRRIFRVSYRDLTCLVGQEECASVYTDEDLAKAHVADLLRTLAKRLEEQAWAARELARAPQYVADAGVTAPLVRSQLDKANVWEAYRLWMDFESRYPLGPEPELGVPLHMQIGGVLVEVVE